MHPDKVWIVIVLVVVILGVSNLAMYALVRGWAPRAQDKTTLQQFKDLTNPLKPDDDKLKELNRRVRELQAGDEEK